MASYSRRPCTEGRCTRRFSKWVATILLVLIAALGDGRLLFAKKSAPASLYHVTATANEIHISTSAINAAIRTKGYVSGVYRGSFVDKKTGFNDEGFGLDIVDFTMEPGSDASYRRELNPLLVNDNGVMIDGSHPKRIVDGPQICTQAKELHPEIIRGRNFVAIRQSFKFYLAAPGRRSGSVWTQLLVFPAGKRYFFSSDRVTTVNSSPCMFLRVDMPEHHYTNTFTKIYLGYYGEIPARAFSKNFPPDTNYYYLRRAGHIPQYIIRGYRLRDPKTGRVGPWVAGMTLEPAVVYDAWCHQRSYVCMIEEIGGLPVKPGDSFGAAYICGFFDSIAEMKRIYRRYAGYDGLEANNAGWKLVKLPAVASKN
jgi:hypothetical protein